MVSLFEMLQRQQNGKTIRTGVASIDELLPNSYGNGGVFEFHSVPGCTEQNKVVAHIIIQHLLQAFSSKVIIVDTLHPFQFHWLTQHPDFNVDTMLEKICWYTVPTYSKLFTLVNSLDSSALLVINNFFELLELYRLEISSVYEEKILKHHIEVNDVVESNIEKIRQEGVMPLLPKLPPNSDLLRESPLKKFNSHVSILTNLFSQYVTKHALSILLLGYLDTQYESIESNNPETQEAATQYQLQYQPKRLMLAPKEYAVSKIIACRLVFFKVLDQHEIKVKLKLQNFREDRWGEVYIDDELLLQSFGTASTNASSNGSNIVTESVATAMTMETTVSDNFNQPGQSGNQDPDVSNAHINVELPSSPDLTASQIRLLLPHSDHSEILQPLQETVSEPEGAPNKDRTAAMLAEINEIADSPNKQTTSPLTDVSIPSEVENSDDEESHILFL